MHPSRRRLISLVCIALLFFAALAAPVSGVVAAVLAPIDPLFGIVAIAPAAAPDEGRPQAASLLSVTGSRAPPVA